MSENYVPPGWVATDTSHYTGQYFLGVNYLAVKCVSPACTHAGTPALRPNNVYNKPLTELTAPEGFKFAVDSKGNIDYRTSSPGEFFLTKELKVMERVAPNWTKKRVVLVAVTPKNVYDNKDLDSFNAPAGYSFLIEGGKRVYREVSIGESYLGASGGSYAMTREASRTKPNGPRLILVKDVPDNVYKKDLESVPVPAGYKVKRDSAGKIVYRMVKKGDAIISSAGGAMFPNYDFSVNTQDNGERIILEPLPNNYKFTFVRRGKPSIGEFWKDNTGSFHLARYSTVDDYDVYKQEVL